jgi:hypothetical protein
MASSAAAAAAETASKAVWGFGYYRTGVEFKGAAFDGESFCVDQGIGNFFVCRCESPPERLPRNFHLLRRLLLIQSLKVGQTDGLELINRQGDVLQNG